jgi:uncharacterized caspase-like protein
VVHPLKIAALLLILITALSFVCSAAAHADKRVALVIGNSAYSHIGTLPNPVNDAELMASTLRDLGFTLIGGGPQINLDKAKIDHVVQDFGRHLQGADVGLFYFAGHGVQVDGVNFLIPVDANPAKRADLDFQMLDAAVVVRQMNGGGAKLSLVILDACRNNPLAGRGLRDSTAGLAQMRAPENTLISFATQPGNTALDGGDGHSPFTKALATTIVQRPGQGLFDTFNNVGLAVHKATGGEQQPWMSNSPIERNFYFTEPMRPTDVPSQAPVSQMIAGTQRPGNEASSSQLACTEAADAWQNLKSTTSIEALTIFKLRYPNCVQSMFAQARIDDLRPVVVVTAPSAGNPQTPRESPSRPQVNIPAARPAVPTTRNGQPSWCHDQTTYNSAEQEICRSAALWPLEAELYRAYEVAKRKGNVAELTATEVQWKERRDACGGNQVCLKNVYQSRVAECKRRSNNPSLKRPGVPVAPE